MNLLRPFRAVYDWWTNLPLGYAELHVPSEASVEEVRHILRTQWAHRLPKDPRARNFRIAFLLMDHCNWQRTCGIAQQRPHVSPVKCRRCGRVCSKCGDHHGTA